MCGIIGILSNKKNNNLDFFQSMINKIKHRGPDSSGHWTSIDSKIILGHTRLSILDLSPNGNQPMVSRSGRFVLVYNGEIYNHLYIRQLIEEKISNYKWLGQSDTETILASFEIFGIKETLLKAEGMFAFAIWDKKNEELIIARDRMGEKPMYYGWVEKNFIFSSELKSIKSYPGFNNNLSNKAISNFFQFSYIQSPLSIYEDIFKLQPGTMLKIKKKNEYLPQSIELLNAGRNDVSLSDWWSLSDTFNKKSIFSEYYKSEKVTTDYLENLITKSVKLQLLSDVPIGSFLSGGIDSSLVTSLMQSASPNNIKTFTIGFDDKTFDESKYANQIAAHLNTDHNHLNLTDLDAFNLIPSLPEIYDEPFADSSQIPTYFVSKFAKSKITVALSGDGGDELFGGYNRYFWSKKVWNKISFLPFPLRIIAGNLLSYFPKSAFDKFENLFSNPDVQNLYDKTNKLSSRLKYVKNIDQLFISLISEWNQSDNILINPEFKKFNLINETPNYEGFTFEDKMMFIDKKTYLPDDILCKVDRASMANSLETRAPFLNSEIIEFASNMPIKYKIKDLKGKMILRNILKKFIPENLYERPKMGFGIPLNKWLKSGLRDWVFDTLNLDKIKKQGIVNPIVLKKFLDEHFNGSRNWETKIWIILMFQSWYDKNYKC